MNTPNNAHSPEQSVAPAPPSGWDVFRLDRESLSSCRMNLTGFQTMAEANRIAAQLCSSLASELSRFLDASLESHTNHLDPVKRSIQTLKDLFQIQRATPGMEPSALEEFGSLEMRLDRFMVYVNVADGMGPKTLGFGDWVQFKHEAVELKFAARAFCDKHEIK